MNVLEVRGLTKAFGATPVLDALDLDLAEGEVLSILGPSGCGKSTLLRLVAGLERPNAGSIRLLGRLVAGDGVHVPPEARHVNMVFQDYALWPHMRVDRIIGYGLRARRQPEPLIRETVGELLSMLRIQHLAQRYPAELSGGQQQRVAIARALATDPDLLLLDEPLSNLDVQLRQDMRQELASLFQRLGTTALYVTHDPVEACTLAQRIIVLRAGRVVEQGTPEALFAQPGSAWVARLAGFDGDLPATLTVMNGRLGEVRIAEHSLGVRLPATPLAPGQAVRLFVDPAAIRLQPATEPGWNRLPGTVLQAHFEGRHWRLVVDCDGARLTLVAPSRAVIGERITLHVPVEETLAFAAES
ncbi:MAG: ABC transporter ATP-binding protein [Geminicoccaceae bacterium]|nr:MAG: ABC transporter ATP-binding protein [Geminicoccaceae bacterium]